VNSRRLAGLLLAVVALTVVTWYAVSAATPVAEGCGPSKLAQIGPQEAHFPEWGGPPLPRIAQLGGQTSIAEARADGFDARIPSPTRVPIRVTIAVRASSDAEITELLSFFADASIEGSTTMADVIGGRGYLLEQRTTTGQDASVVRATLGGLATTVQVGPHDAAITWAAPLTNGGRRPYGLFWSDSKYDWSLTAGFDSPGDVVDLARSLYCS
jgi:hypothetical protein